MSERYMRQAMRWMAMAAILATAVQGQGQSAGKGAETPAQLPPAQPVARPEPAQDERSFQLTFTTRELDENGKVVNARKYDTMMTAGFSNGGAGNIRTGSKIPVPTGNMIQYMDIGANFDMNKVRMVKSNRLAMQVIADITSFEPQTNTEGRPTIRQNRWMGEVEVPIGGRKVIFSSDDLSSKKTLQIELAVTPVMEK